MLIQINTLNNKNSDYFYHPSTLGSQTVSFFKNRMFEIGQEIKSRFLQRRGAPFASFPLICHASALPDTGLTQEDWDIIVESGIVRAN